MVGSEHQKKNILLRTKKLTQSYDIFLSAAVAKRISKADLAKNMSLKSPHLGSTTFSVCSEMIHISGIKHNLFD